MEGRWVWVAAWSSWGIDIADVVDGTDRVVLVSGNGLSVIWITAMQYMVRGIYGR